MRGVASWLMLFYFFVVKDMVHIYSVCMGIQSNQFETVSITKVIGRKKIFEIKQFVHIV
jgi:hypothetical protein